MAVTSRASVQLPSSDQLSLRGCPRSPAAPDGKCPGGRLRGPCHGGGGSCRGHRSSGGGSSVATQVQLVRLWMRALAISLAATDPLGRTLQHTRHGRRGDLADFGGLQAGVLQDEDGALAGGAGACGLGLRRGRHEAALHGGAGHARPRRPPRPSPPRWRPDLWRRWWRGRSRRDRYVTSLASALTASVTREAKRGTSFESPGNTDTYSQAGTHSKTGNGCQGPHTEEANNAGEGAAHQACMTGSRTTAKLRARAGQCKGLHLSSHTGLMQVLPGHTLADSMRECFVIVEDNTTGTRIEITPKDRA